MNRDYPKTNDHILITNLAGIFKVPAIRNSRTLAEALEALENNDDIHLPFRPTDLLPIYEKFPVVPAVLQPKRGSLLMNILLDTVDDIVLLTDSVMVAGETVFVCKLIDDGEVALAADAWLKRMKSPSLLLGTHKQDTIMAAPLKAFAY